MQAALLDSACLRLCQRLVSSEIYLDAPVLTSLGTGELVADLRFGICRHGDRFIPPILAVTRLRNELRSALAGSEDPEDPLLGAELRVNLRMTAQQGGRNSQMFWMGAGEEFVSCAMEIEARLTTAAARGGARHTSHLEWPLVCSLWKLPALPLAAGNRTSYWQKTS
ncbi:MAG: hypothetical protein ABJC74_16425 [Gemmatimonadota bacterium]